MQQVPNVGEPSGPICHGRAQGAQWRGNGRRSTPGQEEPWRGWRRSGDGTILFSNIDTSFYLFLSDPGVPGPIYGSSCLKLSIPFANLTDVTLADEDTNSTDNVKRAIQGNVAMHVTLPGGQLWNQCKWCHLVAKFATNASGPIWWLNLQLK